MNPKSHVTSPEACALHLSIGGFCVKGVFAPFKTMDVVDAFRTDLLQVFFKNAHLLHNHPMYLLDQK